MYRKFFEAFAKMVFLIASLALSLSSSPFFLSNLAYQLQFLSSRLFLLRPLPSAGRETCLLSALINYKCKKGREPIKTTESKTKEAGTNRILG